MTDRKLRVAMLVLNVIGLGVASYLTYIHYAHVNPVCTSSACTTVQHSVYSTVGGVPVALIGLIGYITIFGLLVSPQIEPVRMGLVSVVIIGFGFSAYLTYRELFTLHAVCEWCASSAVIMTLLAILAMTRFVRGADPEVAIAVPAADDGVRQRQRPPVGAR